MRRTLFLRTMGGFLTIVVLATGLFVVFTLALVRDTTRQGVRDRLEATALAVRTAEAIAGRTGYAERWSSTLERAFAYLAVPAAASGGAVVRAAAPREVVGRLAEPAGLRIALFALIILAAGFLAAAAFSRRLTGPFSLLTDMVARVAEGDFRARLHLRASGEVRRLAEGVNAMAERLQAQFDGLAASSRELDVLFASVPAGIAILDADGLVARANPAFGALLRAPRPRGRSLWELTRDPDLIEAVRRARESAAPVVQELALAGRVLLAAASPMERELALVLQDVTDARRLEDTKRELVANVSHELRTPLAAIRGFLEMLEGEVTGEAARAVEVIGRNVRRMSAIVKHIAALHGGRVEVASRVGRGTRFTVRLPSA